jgi:uncharacterized coiled-coil protein SlyX
VRIEKANDINASVVGHEAHTFSSAIIQRKTPGVYTETFGRGKFEIESVIGYFLAPAKSSGDVYQKVDELATVLRNPTIMREVFKAVFSSLTQQISNDHIITTSQEIQARIHTALGAKATTGLTAVIHEIVTEMFSQSKFILPSKGTAFREHRKEIIPSYVDLARDMIKSDLVDIIVKEDLKIKLVAYRFTPASLMSEFERRMGDMGRKIAQSSYALNYFNDALYAIRTYMEKRSELVSALPQKVIKASEFGDLISNITLVTMALSDAVNLPHPTLIADELMSSVQETTKILSRSTRYQVVSLETAVAAYRYEPVVDERQNLVGGVLSYATKFSHPIQVAMFDVITELQDVVQTTRLQKETTDIAALTAPMEGKDIMHVASEACYGLMSAITVDESEEGLRSVLMIVDELSEVDLVHIATMLADTVYVRAVESDDKTFDPPSIVFSKALKGKRLMADAAAFEGVIYTQDPATLILASDYIEPKIPYDMTTQRMLDDVWDMFIVDGNVNGHGVPLEKHFNGKHNLSMQIGGLTLTAEVDIPSLMRQPGKHRSSIVYNPLTPDVFTASVIAPMIAYEYTISEIKDDGEREKMRKALGTQVCHMLFSIIIGPLRSTLFTNLVDDIVRRFVRKVDKRARDLTYKKLHRVNYRVQVELALAFLILKELGVMRDIIRIDAPTSEDEEKYVEASLMKMVHDFIHDNEFYTTLLGADFGNQM